MHDGALRSSSRVFLALHRIMTVYSSCADAHIEIGRLLVQTHIRHASWFARPRLSPTRVGTTSPPTDLGPSQHGHKERPDPQMH